MPRSRWSHHRREQIVRQNALGRIRPPPPSPPRFPYRLHPPRQRVEIGYRSSFHKVLLHFGRRTAYQEQAPKGVDSSRSHPSTIQLASRAYRAGDPQLVLDRVSPWNTHKHTPVAVQRHLTAGIQQDPTAPPTRSPSPATSMLKADRPTPLPPFPPSRATCWQLLHRAPPCPSIPKSAIGTRKGAPS